MDNKRVELLAPAGSPDGFYGAIHAGADAVYLAGERFGARAYANNFTTEELIDCIRYAHLWGRKVYLTVNTLVKEKEFSQLYPYLLPFYEAGLDGVIVQDIGVFQYIGKCFPYMELHVSTQMTLTGEYGARLLKDMGAKRIVPARELSLEEISHLKRTTGLEIETFIHGAMCYCYSGQCLFSSILGGRSGNRGRCAQPCRLPYAVSIEEKLTEDAYPLSLKDMCTLEHIPRFIEAGIDSFKIEGRMKKPEYTAGVTAIYRKYIDKYYEQPNTGLQVEKSDMEALSRLYIRSKKQDGYYFRHNGADMVTMDNPAYSESDEALLQKIREQYLMNKPKKKIQINAEFTLGALAKIVIVCGSLSVSMEGQRVESAQKQPVTEENIGKQLKKLGDTIFKVDTMDIKLSGEAFYPLKALNQLRRDAVTELENALIKENRGSSGRTASAQMELAISNGKDSNILDNAVDCTRFPNENLAKSLIFSIRTDEQLQAIYCFIHREHFCKISRIYLDMDLVNKGGKEIFGDIVRALSQKCDIFLALPYILRKRDGTYLDNTWKALKMTGVSGCLVRSLEGYGWLAEKDYKGSIAADAGIYIWNKETLSFWKDKLASFTLPYELNSREQQEISSKEMPCEKLIYGRLPMMLTANCVVRTMGQCLLSKQGTNKMPLPEKTVFLKDRYRKHFPVVLNCEHCTNIIYNSVPLSLHSTIEKWYAYTGLRMDFTIENGQETYQLLEYFDKMTSGRNTLPQPFSEYTTGHEKRGVE